MSIFIDMVTINIGLQARVFIKYNVFYKNHGFGFNSKKINDEISLALARDILMLEVF